MIGTENKLVPISDNKLILKTHSVNFSPGIGKIKAFFNRGILSTQSLVHKLPHGNSGKPSLGALQKEINDDKSAIRKSLAGDLLIALPQLINRAIKEGGKCYCALYELTDPQLIKLLKDSKDNVEVILSNANGSETVYDDGGQ